MSGPLDVNHKEASLVSQRYEVEATFAVAAIPCSPLAKERGDLPLFCQHLPLGIQQPGITGYQVMHVVITDDRCPFRCVVDNHLLELVEHSQAALDYLKYGPASRTRQSLRCCSSVCNESGSLLADSICATASWNCRNSKTCIITSARLRNSSSSLTASANVLASRRTRICDVSSRSPTRELSSSLLSSHPWERSPLRFAHSARRRRVRVLPHSSSGCSDSTSQSISCLSVEMKSASSAGSRSRKSASISPVR